MTQPPRKRQRSEHSTCTIEPVVGQQGAVCMTGALKLLSVVKSLEAKHKQ